MWSTIPWDDRAFSGWLAAVRRCLSAGPETIWKALTTADLVARWLMVSDGFEPVEGRRFTYQTKPAGAWDGTIHCKVLEVTPNACFAFAFAWKSGDEGNIRYGSRLDTVVAFTLTREDSGPRLRLVHSGFVLPANDVAFKNMGEGWKKVVPNIGTVAGEVG